MKTVQTQKEERFSMSLGAPLNGLADSIAALKLNGEELLWSVRHDGLYHASMDPEHIQLIEVRALAKKLSSGRKAEFAIKLADMLKVINRADDDDILQVSMDPEPAEKPVDYRRSVRLALKNTRRVLEYELYLIEPTNPISPLPKHEPQASIKSGTQTIKDILADMAVASELVTLETDLAKRTVRFSSSGDSGKAARTLDAGDGVDIAPLGTDLRPVVTTYNIERMSKYLKTVKEDDITIEYATAKPLKATSISDNITTTFYLAPRAQS
ncbi:MAG: hypothetical protein JRN62_03920 [Nitrososphaerota archaeon]|jgi:hypothetical protein|nr:hypothetical protein [Nitrososphaerota archaeon]MDG6948750.1 hypothetical protein [Nitrososphaerota archaeon]